jgi:hypothetical protein
MPQGLRYVMRCLQWSISQCEPVFVQGVGTAMPSAIMNTSMAIALAAEYPLLCHVTHCL